MGRHESGIYTLALIKKIMTQLSTIDVISINKIIYHYK